MKKSGNKRSESDTLRGRGKKREMRNRKRKGKDKRKKGEGEKRRRIISEKWRNEGKKKLRENRFLCFFYNTIHQYQFFKFTLLTYFLNIIVHRLNVSSGDLVQVRETL